jgi:hypothetical protein
MWLFYSVIDVDFHYRGRRTAGDAYLPNNDAVKISLWRTDDITAKAPQWQRVLLGPAASGNTLMVMEDV